jgi:hypothetical protein
VVENENVEQEIYFDMSFESVGPAQTCEADGKIFYVSQKLVLKT